MKLARALCLAGGAALLTTGAMVVSLTAAHADVATGFVEFGGDEYVAFDVEGPGQPVLVYMGERAGVPDRIPIVLNNCRVVNGPDLDALLRLDWDKLVIVNNGLGTGNRCQGRGNGVISDNETLTIRPGTAFGDDPFTSALLNIQAKFGVDLAYWFGAPDGDPNLAPLPGSGPGGDSGNDAFGDHTMVPIVGSEPFASLTIAPRSPDGKQNAEISLENGGDGVPTEGPSVFYLGSTFEYTLDCGEQVTVEGPTDAHGSPDWAVVSTTFLRLDNDPRGPDDGYGECDLIGLDVSYEIVPGAGAEGVIIDHSAASATGGPQAVRGRVTVVFKVERFDADGNARAAADVNAELERNILYPGEGEEAQLIAYCLDYDDLADRATHPAADDPEGRPDGTPSWCVLSDTRVLDDIDDDGDDEIVQTIVLDATGDPAMW